MVMLPKQQISYWQASADALAFSELNKNLETDVVIVGGGIAGITCAYILKQSGYKVVVLEKNTIGSGTTSKTTGKITSQHGLICSKLINTHGAQVAQLYADANQEAFNQIIRLIKNEKIKCDLEFDDNYVYTTDAVKVGKFKAEAKAASNLGLPASYVIKANLPFNIQAAVKFSGQARFNAQKYVQALASAVNRQGSHVFENSEVNYFKDGVHAYVKSNGYQVAAKFIIVATKIPTAPLAARGLYGLLEYPHTSYIVAGKYNGKLKGMYISPDKNHYSVMPINSSDGQILLIGGQEHIPGLGNPAKRYQKLADYAAENFRMTSIDYSWKGMDYLPYDDLPLIGKLSPWSKNIYVTTGFKKWGLTTSMVSAIILRDLIAGQENPWSKVFDSTRIKPILSIPRKMFS
jgi:glycine/D-amino acid oxidase-like deaminating enzyme